MRESFVGMGWRAALRVCHMAALLVVVLLWLPAARVQAAGVVGTGTPQSCTEAAFTTAMENGGEVSFNCGAAPHTITLGRIYQIAQPTTIRGGGLITLSGGNTTGLFQVFSNAALTLENITLERARGGQGYGAIENFGTLTVRNSRFLNHVSTSKAGALLNHGVATIEDSVFNSNRATTEGGAIVSDGGTLTVGRTRIEANTAATNGAGVVVSGGTATLTQVTISGNELPIASTGQAGGLLVGGNASVTLVESTISNNRGFDGGGAYVASDASLTVQRATFAQNVAAYGAGIEASGTLSIVNSTFNANQATNDGGAIWILNTTTPARLNHVTLIGNQATNGRAINVNGGSLQLQRSVISGSGVQCVGAVTASADSFATDATCGSATVRANLLLGPLADNGGPTQTALPQAGSPVIDAIPCDAAVTDDQRKAPRPAGALCDAGAVEVGNAPPPVNQQRVYLPLVQR
ncbi:MAG: hypothetical protein MUD01_22180 [Chloroflexaceae bacterium]|nr:hypothetical protein [Chloroflexaceae bacterium]